MNVHAITDLEHDERLALLGLVRMVVRADHDVSQAEAAVVGELAGSLDAGAWQALVRAARERYPSQAEARRAAARINRARCPGFRLPATPACRRKRRPGRARARPARVAGRGVGAGVSAITP